MNPTYFTEKVKEPEYVIVCFLRGSAENAYGVRDDFSTTIFFNPNGTQLTYGEYNLPYIH